MNQIHPTAIIGKDVQLGLGNTIGPYTIIEGPVVIGDNNTIGPHTVIGCPATDTKRVDYGYANPHVRIGNRCTIREFSVVEQPCYEDITLIEDDVFIMQGVHVSHDAHLYSGCTITNTTVIAGLVKVLPYANISMACTLNQYTVVGQYSIVATNAACMKNVRPFSRYIPGKPISVNRYAIKKFDLEEYAGEIEAYVMDSAKVTSPCLVEIVSLFDSWVLKYGHDTY